MDQLRHDRYENPLIERYASSRMSYIFSGQFKFSTWRKLWVALAEAQQELGLPISDQQIAEMKAHIDDIDFDRAEQMESQTRHDVMAHIHTFAEVCPTAKPIIHLGATSAFVGDNTDLIQFREASRLLLQRLTAILEALREFALKYKELPTLGFTHFQPAQCTTVGKRASLWLLDFSLDFDALRSFIETLPMRGAKGTTGTQASFMYLFDDDHDKVKKLDQRVAEKMGFSTTFGVTGQTYTRKIDAMMVSILSGIAQSAHKFANDIRLLQHLKEIEEPFEKNQVGSSAMAYKRNPMRSERLTSLSRFILSLSTSPAMTAAQQWFERTLDDSANKRLVIPEAFLATDAVCSIVQNIASGLVVYPAVIGKHLREELPFMATENILMEAVKKGGDRQTLHERIRLHSIAAAKKVKEEGLANDLLDRISDDATFGFTVEELRRLLDVSKFTGRAARQTEEFIENQIDPRILRGREYGSIDAVELKV